MLKLYNIFKVWKLEYIPTLGIPAENWNINWNWQGGEQGEREDYLKINKKQEKGGRRK